MTDTAFSGSFGERSLQQQGYDYTAAELTQLEWGLRFTPAVCMVGAIAGLVFQLPLLHFGLAALGIIPFWFPASHPVDRFYNSMLRPLWGGVALPANPLPRRIACLMGGVMNVAIGVSFVLDSPPAAYVFGAILVALQLIVITTHFCVASWIYEGLVRLVGRWERPITAEEARSVIAAGGQLIDVRTPQEFASGHIEGAVNLPVNSIGDHSDGLGGAPVVVYCRSGMRSQKARQVLTRAGVNEVHDLGAMSRWDA
jgi:rhodanese-related sulfurtransferase